MSRALFFLRRGAPLRALLAGPTIAIAAALVAGCGSGGSEPAQGVAEAPSGLRVVNAQLTARGGLNTHALVGLSYRSAAGGPEVVLPPFELAPGATLDIPVPVGAWNFQALFDDGHQETVQSPGDAVYIYAEDRVDLLFMY